MKKETPNSRVRMALENCFPNNVELSVTDIKELLLKEKEMRYVIDYSEGNLAGILRVLTTTGFLEKVARGVYIKRNEEILKEVRRETKEKEKVKETAEETTEETRRNIQSGIKEFKCKKAIMEKIVCEMGDIINTIVINVDTTEDEIEKLKGMVAFRKTMVEVLGNYEV